MISVRYLIEQGASKRCVLGWVFRTRMLENCRTASRPTSPSHLHLLSARTRRPKPKAATETARPDVTDSEKRAHVLALFLAFASLAPSTAGWKAKTLYY